MIRLFTSPISSCIALCFAQWRKIIFAANNKSCAHTHRKDELIKFNENHSYNWNGCGKLALGQGLCLSYGTPPKPKSDPSMNCMNE